MTWVSSSCSQLLSVVVAGLPGQPEVLQSLRRILGGGGRVYLHQVPLGKWCIVGGNVYLHQVPLGKRCIVGGKLL